MEYGPYRLDMLLGQGGFGQVYRGVNTRTNRPRPVAVKILPVEFAADPDYRTRFLRECRILAGLQNPSIVPVHNYGEVDGQLFLEMELLDGADLGRTITAAGRLTAPRSVGVVEQVADALDCAHAADLLHRDVKPGNIMVGAAEAGDVVHLIDFGIARPRVVQPDQQITATGVLIGTFAYLAPEAWEGRAGAQADVYALACVLFECLTGRRAFIQQDMVGYLHAHTHEVPAPVTDLVPDLPAGLARVVARGLAKDPRLRYASAGELARAARASLSGALTVSERRPVLLLPHLDGRIRVWDARTAALLGPGFDEGLGHQAIHAVVDAGGRTVVVSGAARHHDGPVWAWDMETGEPVRDRIVVPPPGRIVGVTTTEWDGEVWVVVDSNVLQHSYWYRLAGGDAVHVTQGPSDTAAALVRAGLSRFHGVSDVRPGLHRGEPVVLAGGHPSKSWHSFAAVFDLRGRRLYYSEVPGADPRFEGQSVWSVDGRVLLVRHAWKRPAPIEIIDLDSGALVHRSAPVRVYEPVLIGVDGDVVAFASEMTEEGRAARHIVWNTATGAELASFPFASTRGLLRAWPAELVRY